MNEHKDPHKDRETSVCVRLAPSTRIKVKIWWGSRPGWKKHLNALGSDMRSAGLYMHICIRTHRPIYKHAPNHAHTSVMPFSSPFEARWTWATPTSVCMEAIQTHKSLTQTSVLISFAEDVKFLSASWTGVQVHGSYFSLQSPSSQI